MLSSLHWELLLFPLCLGREGLKMGFALGAPGKVQAGEAVPERWVCWDLSRLPNTTLLLRDHLLLSGGFHPLLMFGEQGVYPPRVGKQALPRLEVLECIQSASQWDLAWLVGGVLSLGMLSEQQRRWLGWISP